VPNAWGTGDLAGVHVVRWRGTEPSRSGLLSGVFAHVNSLFLHGLLSDEDVAFRETHNAWYHQHVPVPTEVDPTVYDRALNPGAVSWFRSTATDCIARVAGCLAILDGHGIPWERVRTTDPGLVLYEDELQVVARPIARSRA
jgi:hypothetical protein